MSVEQYQLLGFAAETTELTAATLTASNYQYDWSEIGGIDAEGDVNERLVRRAAFSPLQPVGGAYIGKGSGTFRPVPSGTDGTAPGWYALLSAAGFSISGDVATIGATDTAYAVKGTSVTMVHRDGNRARTLAGARLGSMTFSAEKGGLWGCAIEATGRYSEASDTSFPSVSLPSIAPQAFLGHAVSLGGSAVSVASIEIKITNTVSPVEDGTHATGFGRNIITGQRATLSISVLDDSTDWWGKWRNDSSSDVLAFSAVMATGTTGNVLTWTGNVALTDVPVVEFRDGNGYRTLVGEFVATSTSAVLTLTQT